MNKYSKLVKNSVIFSVGNFFSKSLSILMLPFYTRVLTTEEFGQADLITTTIVLLIPFLTVNIVEAIVRFSLDKKNYSHGQVLSNSTFFISFGVIILLLLYPLISKVQFIKEYIMIFYLLFIIQALRTSIKQYARSVDMIKVYMLSDIWYSLSFVFFNIIFLFIFKIGVLGYLLSMILGYTVDLIYLFCITKAYRFIKFKYLNIFDIKTMFVYCLPLMPNSVMWWITGISDRYIISSYSGLGSAGLYAAASRFPTIITTVYSLFYKAWQVSAFEEYENKNKETFYSNVFVIFFFFLIIVASLFLMFNKFIVSIFLSERYYEVWKYTPFLILGAVFSSFSGFLGTNYQAAKKTAGVLYSSIIGAVINLLLNFLLIPQFGIYGAAIATVISFSLIWLIRIIDTKRFVKIYYPVLRMLLVFSCLAIQIFLQYFNINWIPYSIINCLVFMLILFTAKKYIKHPIKILLLQVVNKLR